MSPYFFLLCLTLAFPLEATLLRVCYENSEMQPYTHGDDVSPEPGFLPDLIEQASKESNLNLVFYRRPWGRCMLDLEQGQAEGIFPLIWTAEREQWAAFPQLATGGLDPERYLWEGSYSIFVRYGSNLRWDGERFSQLKNGVAAPFGYVAQQRLNQLGIPGPQHISVEKGLALVALKRLDGYVVDSLIGKYLIHKYGLNNDLTTLRVPFMSSKWYLALSKHFVRHHPDHAQELWTALEKIRHKQRDAARLLNSHQGVGQPIPNGVPQIENTKKPN